VHRVASAADRQAAQATFLASTAVFSIPARTAAVFVLNR
jgi:hypothetical protein